MRFGKLDLLEVQWWCRTVARDRLRPERWRDEGPHAMIDDAINLTGDDVAACPPILTRAARDIIVLTNTDGRVTEHPSIGDALARLTGQISLAASPAG